jgi:hypothetical protein
MPRKNTFFGVTFFLFLSVSCASTPPRGEPFYTRLFAGNYDEVWLATLKALNDYPLKISNKDTGKIISETVNGPYNELLFTPVEPVDLPERYRYSLRFNFAKLVTDEDRPLTRVRIIKSLERFQDFYSGWTASFSDGIEEQILLYRIEHILQMEQMLGDS